MRTWSVHEVLSVALLSVRTETFTGPLSQVETVDAIPKLILYEPKEEQFTPENCMGSETNNTVLSREESVGKGINYEVDGFTKDTSTNRYRCGLSRRATLAHSRHQTGRKRLQKVVDTGHMSKMSHRGKYPHKHYNQRWCKQPAA